MFRRDLATGKVDLRKNKTYKTKGPKSVAGVKNKVPGTIKNTCFTRTPGISCTDEQLEALARGDAVVERLLRAPRGVLYRSLFKRVS
jgi:carboxypeptidase D